MKLTPRERQVAALVSMGYSNKQIAESLSISHNTVARHMQSIFEKLVIHDRTSLGVYAVREGIAS